MPPMPTTQSRRLTFSNNYYLSYALRVPRVCLCGTASHGIKVHPRMTYYYKIMKPGPVYSYTYVRRSMSHTHGLDYCFSNMAHMRPPLD